VVVPISSISLSHTPASKFIFPFLKLLILFFFLRSSHQKLIKRYVWDVFRIYIRHCRQRMKILQLTFFLRIRISFLFMPFILLFLLLVLLVFFLFLFVTRRFLLVLVFFLLLLFIFLNCTRFSLRKLPQNHHICRLPFTCLTSSPHFTILASCKGRLFASTGNDSI
jgi:hypothetical protein